MVVVTTSVIEKILFFSDSLSFNAKRDIIAILHSRVFMNASLGTSVMLTELDCVSFLDASLSCQDWHSCTPSRVILLNSNIIFGQFLQH